MSSNQVTLALAAFMDSSAARRLVEPPRPLLRQVAERVIRACFEQQGAKPNLLEGHQLEELLLRDLPGHFQPKDPLAEHVPAVLEALLAHLEASEVVPHLFELRMVLEPGAQAFLDLVRRGENRELHGKKQETVVHRADKLGRNDPCFCGSGKKFKKCHGRA